MRKKGGGGGGAIGRQNGAIETEFCESEVGGSLLFTSTL